MPLQTLPERFEGSTYCMSVLSYADRNGNLTKAEVSQLLREHGTDSISLYIDGYDGGHNAVNLLTWLGY